MTKWKIVRYSYPRRHTCVIYKPPNVMEWIEFCRVENWVSTNAMKKWLRNQFFYDGYHAA